MERFVSIDDNAANGRRESRVVGKFIVLLGLVLFGPFKYYTHANPAGIKRVFNDVVQTAERSRWQEVWKSKAKLGCEAEDWDLC